MEDRQDRTIADRIEKLIGMPGRGQRSGFGLTIADDAGNDELRIVEHRSE